MGRDRKGDRQREVRERERERERVGNKARKTKEAREKKGARLLFRATDWVFRLIPLFSAQQIQARTLSEVFHRIYL